MKKHKPLITKLIFIVVFLSIWEYVSIGNKLGPKTEIILPSLGAIGKAFVKNFVQGYAGQSLWIYIGNSMWILLVGLFIGILLAFVFSGLSIINETFRYIYDFMVSIFDLLPGIALLPVVIIIFGIRVEVIIFLVVHSVLWPMSRNILDGFSSIPRIFIEAGKNINLRGLDLVLSIYLPAAATHIISGLKSGWARAWRGLISAEMIFGIASSPGLGLYINQMRTNLNNAEMYATLLVIIIVGAFVQYGILQPIENHTIRKWGMVR